MFNKLKEISEKFEEITRQMSDPQIISDQKTFQKLAREHAGLSGIVEKYREYMKVEEDLSAAEQILDQSKDDPDMIEMARLEIDSLRNKKAVLEKELRIMLIPKDPNDGKNIFLEIRAGTGGEEAALFAADLFRMYTRYAERKRWRVEVMHGNPTGVGGFKEIITLIEGTGVYSQLKYESGVHRVQRIPVTEAGGRIHTSAVTVAVLPEAEDVELEIDAKDLKIDVFRSSGPGGQSVNTTDSAVRITHLPSGMVVSCQDEKSQLKNKNKGMKILRARLLDQLQQEQEQKIAKDRKSQIGTGDRSERIRTYNFPQNRITDHRIGLTLYRLDAILEGDLDEVIGTLTSTMQAEALKGTL
ncbi:MAG: peptide chain release factor 1 [Nitrospirae bacterium CG_4_9_14_3_um_filter_53_35]|nr:MAG: peptide chain release factor 1 [Nitrospirae bacterium CG2_30_53_67]PIS35989.1 MAG: peptide chain release factor 1 [Nitrospirae bacterium CG08_land_8_20_14_0_20_52_24]PIX85243.1 MAG: peptide chain release factor 1 [Nitrospirae bacterium CG_4_10_14_3_um_filter_53_41]PJA74529.1 MAG: peptide chain release factor 1 [Nitrospirae bacterium CG_4_9_14_3_um_filter_53_35]